ncbi:Mediator of RNA polymerase II transcription subunit 20a [Ancistrocladus abbreviatus]
MPMKWVLHWHPNTGSTVNTQILNEISQCVETINGVKEGRWKAVLTFYKPILRDQSLAAEFPRDFLGLSLPEEPNKYYFILRGQRLVLEADSSIQVIMDKLQSYKSRVSLNFEGSQYRLGDFQVRVGKVVPSHSENMRGIVMEDMFCRANSLRCIDHPLLTCKTLRNNCFHPSSFNPGPQVEYLPISSINKSRQVMQEFVDIWQEALSKKSLPGQFVHIEPNFAEYGLADQYTSQHTAVQYATVMAQLIATSQSAQAMRN